MNNDLDVKSAFDNLYETIIELHEIRTVVEFKRNKKYVE